MPDDRSQVGKPDRIRVNIHEPYELVYWAGRFGVSQQAVITAVNAVGVMVSDVEQYLRNQNRR